MLTVLSFRHRSMSGRNTLPQQSHWGLLQFYCDHDASSAYSERAQSTSSGTTLELGGHPQIIKQFKLRLPEPLKNTLDFLCAHHFHMKPHPLITTLISDALSVALEEYQGERSPNGFNHIGA